MLLAYPNLTVGPILCRSFGPALAHNTAGPEF